MRDGLTRTFVASAHQVRINPGAASCARRSPGQVCSGHWMFADHVYVPLFELHTYVESQKEKIIGDILPLAVTGPVPAGTAGVSILDAYKVRSDRRDAPGLRTGILRKKLLWRNVHELGDFIPEP